MRFVFVFLVILHATEAVSQCDTVESAYLTKPKPERTSNKCLNARSLLAVIIIDLLGVELGVGSICPTYVCIMHVVPVEPEVELPSHN